MIFSIIKKLYKFRYSYILNIVYAKLRIYKYYLLSDAKHVNGKPIKSTPVLLSGIGNITFCNNVLLGMWNSPFFYNSYFYIEARDLNSQIFFGNNVTINNAASIISDGAGIFINDDTIIGTNFTVFDSDFHSLDIYKRNEKGKTHKVVIEKNVFIGSNVTVLKGVTIGENSIIANGSIVTKSIPANVIAGGVPCKVLKNL